MLRAALALLVLALIAGCGVDDEPRVAPPSEPPAAKPDGPAAKRPHWPRRVRCPRDAANCSSARGTILYIEAKDPDGDGDAHLVLTSTESITGPGLTVVDVEKSLRPHPLPRVGDRVSAAGPVYRGSHGQRQIQATRLRVVTASAPSR